MQQKNRNKGGEQAKNSCPKKRSLSIALEQPEYAEKSPTGYGNIE